MTACKVHKPADVSAVLAHLEKQGCAIDHENQIVWSCSDSRETSGDVDMIFEQTDWAYMSL